ncbi:restriction endonuclease subunit S [Enterococcus dispar]|uniref:restriction endonuclease subunit S n=1 Tax=Enterococcus dispar TaxID=44009 RepID=UPI002330A285|nr:restriction endonuclease subunit S [Enterococcus dispar]WCG32223.1 restriction endonuclease subunit S [Enterococcus dispar]
MSEKKPTIRFKGFDNDWEQRKLGEVAEIVGGGTPSTGISEYWEGDIDWYSPAEIDSQIYVSESQKKITELGLQKSSAKILPVGTVLFTSRAGIGNTAILAKHGSTNQGFQSIVPRENILDSYFIFSRTNELKKYGEVTGAGSTFVEVSGKQMSKMPIRIPSLIEQKQIGNFFKQLDNTITLHQQQLENLKKAKKGYLQKMFPKNNEKVPEIRFEGFTDDWEQRKLGDILSERKIRSKISKEIPLLAFAAGQGVIDRSERKTNNRDFLTKDANTKTYLLTKYNDIVYNPSNLKYGAIDRNKYGLGVISPIYATFETNQVPEFIELIVTSYSFKQRALQYEEGTVTKRQSVKPENLLTLDVSISKTLEEQQKIGTFFQQLDNTIALHQRKLDYLKEMKKGLLQKMFV